MQLAAALHTRGSLRELVMPSRRATRSAARFASLVLPSGARRQRYLSVDHGPLPSEVGPVLEGLRLLARVGLAPGGAADPMRAVRQPFDRAVARRRRQHGVGDVLLGMPGATRTSFLAGGDAYRVLHQVDGHPDARNEALAVFGERARRELVPVPLSDGIRRELDLAEVVLVPSEAVRRQLIHAAVDPRKLFHVPYGVNVDRFQAPGSERQPGPRRLLYVGQVSYRKGIPFLVEACRRGDFVLDLVGPLIAPELIRNLPVNVRYRETVSNADLTTLFAQADAFILPSVEDAFGLVVTEALASGLPVITTRQTGASEVMEGVDGVVLEAGDVDRLRKSLQEIPELSLSDRRTRAGRFRDRVASGDVHSWGTYTAAVISGIEDRLRLRTDH